MSLSQVMKQSPSLMVCSLVLINVLSAGSLAVFMSITYILKKMCLDAIQLLVCNQYWNCCVETHKLFKCKALYFQKINKNTTIHQRAIDELLFFRYSRRQLPQQRYLLDSCTGRCISDWNSECPPVVTLNFNTTIWSTTSGANPIHFISKPIGISKIIYTRTVRKY